jgi:hypothetical protein
VELVAPLRPVDGEIWKPFSGFQSRSAKSRMTGQEDLSLDQLLALGVGAAIVEAL